MTSIADSESISELAHRRLGRFGLISTHELHVNQMVARETRFSKLSTTPVDNKRIVVSRLLLLSRMNGDAPALIKLGV